MDALERRELCNYLWFGEDFERSRMEFVEMPHRGYRRWVRSSPEHARQAIRDARAAAPDGLRAFCVALRPHFSVYGAFLQAAEERGLADG